MPKFVPQVREVLHDYAELGTTALSKDDETLIPARIGLVACVHGRYGERIDDDLAPGAEGGFYVENAKGFSTVSSIVSSNIRSGEQTQSCSRLSPILLETS